MSRLCVSVFLCVLILSPLSRTGAESEERSVGSDEDRSDERRSEEKRTMPYWNMWSSDFYGWVEELRAQAAYDTLLDLAKTYWSHFPIASYLGYDTISDQDDQIENEADE